MKDFPFPPIKQYKFPTLKLNPVEKEDETPVSGHT